MNVFLVSHRDSFGDQGNNEELRSEIHIALDLEDAKKFALEQVKEIIDENKEILLSPLTATFDKNKEIINVHSHTTSDDTRDHKWDHIYLCIKMNIPLIIHPNIEKYSRNLKESSGLCRMLIQHFDEQGHYGDSIDQIFKTEFGPMMWWVSMFLQQIGGDRFGALDDALELLIAKLFGLITEEKNKTAHDLVLEYLQKNSASEDLS